MTARPAPYRGRFAPSPTGPLHFGSLVAALGSFADARSKGGQWLVRMEDLDPPREVPGAADRILRTLEAFGFEWDGPVLYQSRRSEAYLEAIRRLETARHLYPCSCSRTEIARAGRQGAEGSVYPGTCRDAPVRNRKPPALRVRTHGETIAFHDRIQGRVEQSVEAEIGDFVVRRADGLFAYQIAVVVDDARQGINQVVRGADLLLSTPRQILLQSLLGYPTPTYAHLPLVVDEGGRKLSKQANSLPVDAANPLPALMAALAFLGQPLPEEASLDLEAFWQWTIGHWKPDLIPRVAASPLSA